MKPGLVIGLNKRRGGLKQNTKDVSHLEKLAFHVSKLGWDVIFEKGAFDSVTPSKMQIVINSRTSRKTQLISLLHEAGHATLFHDPDYVKKFPNGYFGVKKPHHKRTLRHKVDVLREEIAAWEQAEKIIKDLKIDLDIKDFRDQRNKSILTYMNWD
jgi:hypothetical protein